MIIAIANIYIRDGFGTNLNDREKQYKLPKEETKEGFSNQDEEPEECRREDPEKPEITIKINHYSKDYSENIITELMYLNKIYPGVPEFVMSLYVYNENRKTDKLVYMPFGRPLPTDDYVYNLGTEFMVNSKLFSFNNRYALTINRNGFVYVYDVINRNILYFLHRGNNDNNNFISMTFETTGLVIVYKDENDNLKPVSKDILPRIPLIKSNCDECSEPYSMILDDNGTLVIYGNGFYDSTFDGFKEMINKERNLMEEVKQRGGDNELLNVDKLKTHTDNNNKDKLSQYANINDFIYGNDINEPYVYRTGQ
jgi:hypothetical protein